MSYDEVFRAAQSLSDEDRLRLLHDLSAGLTAEPAAFDEGIDQAWIEEATRRARELDADPGLAIDGDEFLREMRNRHT